MAKVIIGIALWAGLLITGFVGLTLHQMRSGEAAKAPQRARPTETMRLLLFAHPQCPCTRATVEELDRLIVDVKGRIDVTVYVLQPSSKPASWAKAALFHRAEAIKGVHVELDPDGAKAAEYGASTSGQVLLYSPEGKLLFSGGITASRAHEGDNAGRDAIADIILKRKTTVTSTPVFGCSLGLPKKI